MKLPPATRPWGEVASAGDPFLHRVEASLPAAYPLIGGQPVLEEIQGPPRLEDSPQLVQGGGGVGDGAQRPGGQGGVEPVVREGQRLAVQTGPLNEDVCPSATDIGQLPAHVGRLDRGDTGDGSRIEGDIQPRSEADLDNVPGETSADPPAQRFQPLAATRVVEDPREHPIVVDAQCLHPLPRTGQPVCRFLTMGVGSGRRVRLRRTSPGNLGRSCLRKRLVTDAVAPVVNMRVEVWSDVVCPWCYIGKRRFEAALARFDHRDEVELVWRSFELDVSAPPSSAEQGTYAERLAGKYGCSDAEAQAMIDNMTVTAAREGLDFRFDLARPGNTFDAHRLLHLALEHGRQDDLKERLDAATFTEGSPASDHSALRALATQVGLPEVEVDAVLTSDRYSDAVRADEAQARAYGISGVPFFVIDGRYGISGAQPADAVLQTLDKAWSERPPLTLVTPEGSAPSCEGDSCVV